MKTIIWQCDDICCDDLPFSKRAWLAGERRGEQTAEFGTWGGVVQYLRSVGAA